MVFGFSNLKSRGISERFLKLSLGAYYTEKISKERLATLWKNFFDVNTSIEKETLSGSYLYREKESNRKDDNE